MSNAIIATPEWSDSATITTNSPDAEFPVTNLQLRNPTDIFKSVATTFTITLDRGVTKPANLVSLLFHNGSEFSGFRVRTADSEAGLTSAPVYDSGAPFFEGLHFSEGPNAIFPTAAAPTSAMTIEMAFKPLKLASQGIYIIGGANSFRIYMDADGRIHVALSDLDIQSINPVGLNEWGFISVTHSNTGDVELWIDGVSQSTGSSGVGWSTPVINLLNYNQDGGVLHGVVGEFRIWDDKRTDLEISVNFDNTVAVGSSNLWGYYRMQDGPGASTVITDWTSNGRDGTVVVSAGLRAQWVDVNSMWASPSIGEHSRRHAVLFIPGGVNNRWMLINITDTTNPDGHLEIGRLYVSDAWQMDTNVAYGSSPFSFEDRSVVSTTYAGTNIIRQREPSKLQTMLIQAYSEKEIMEDLFRLSTRMGIDILAIQDPESAYRFQKMVYGTIVDRYDVVNPLFEQFESIVRLKGLM